MSALFFQSRRTKESYKNNLKQHLLINLHELLVPFLDIGSLLAGIGVVIDGGWGIVLVVLAPFDDLLENGFVDLRECKYTVRKREANQPSLRLGWGLGSRERSLQDPPTCS